MSDGWRILITGIAGALASSLARRLADHDGVEQVVGVDTRLPVQDLRRTRIVRAELTSPVIGEVLERERIDTVVHLDITSAPSRAGGRSQMKEHNVIGTMQLLAAAQRSSRLRTVVLRSSTAVYGSDASNQALFSEDVTTQPTTGYGRDVAEAEGYARALSRRRDDVVLTVLRFANVLGGDVDSSFARYLSLPVVPTVLGYDPRIQLCHASDAVEVLRHAVLDTTPGIYNVAGRGVLYLSQAVRIVGRPTVPVPLPMVDGIGAVLRRVRDIDVPTDELRYLSFGHVADISRMLARFEYEPKYTTRDTLEAFVAEREIRPVIDETRWRGLQRGATRLARAADEVRR